MEGKNKVDLTQVGVKQLMEDEEKTNLEGSFIVVNNDDDDKGRLLTRLLNQLETSRADEEVCQLEAEEEVPSPAAIGVVKPESKTAVEVENVNTQSAREDIIKELRSVKRQNFITHCLLSVMIVLTVAWQVSEVSLILKVKGKVKDGISHPFRSFGNMITGILKRPEGNGDQRGKQSPSMKKNIDAFPALKISELCPMDFPVSDFGADQE